MKEGRDGKYYPACKSVFQLATVIPAAHSNCVEDRRPSSGSGSKAPTGCTTTAAPMCCVCPIRSASSGATHPRMHLPS
jgi:hypothetical protein